MCVLLTYPAIKWVKMMCSNALNSREKPAVSPMSGRVIDSCLAKSRCWALNSNMKVGKQLTKIQKERDMNTDLNYWIKFLSCIIEANGGHIGLSHINLHWYYWGSRRGFYRFRLLVGMDKHCVNEISFTNNFCFFLNLPVNNELGIVQDGRHEFIIKCFKPSQNH